MTNHRRQKEPLMEGSREILLRLIALQSSITTACRQSMQKFDLNETPTNPQIPKGNCSPLIRSDIVSYQNKEILRLFHQKTTYVAVFFREVVGYYLSSTIHPAHFSRECLASACFNGSVLGKWVLQGLNRTNRRILRECNNIHPSSNCSWS